MKQIIYRFIFFKLLGWKVKGTFDTNIKKCIMIVVPHTSWFDFFIGVFFRGTYPIEINFLAKKELFKFPLGGYLKWMGGIALDRSKTENKVDAIAQLFETKDVLRLSLSPEGTRKKVTDWKSGYYYIAQKANLPIIPIGFDYTNKQVVVFEPFTVTNDFEKDSKYLKSLYTNIQGKIVENSFTN
jgi:1-acyl-sn-glycerol-3-phosphate acyltransferase